MLRRSNLFIEIKQDFNSAPEELPEYSQSRVSTLCISIIYPFQSQSLSKLVWPNTEDNSWKTLVKGTNRYIISLTASYYLHLNKKHCIFALLIKKDGGIRPCEVLATCAYKVLHSIPVNSETDKWKSIITDFSKISLF